MGRLIEDFSSLAQHENGKKEIERRRCFVGQSYRLLER